MITKETKERIEVNEDGTLQVAEITRFIENGEVVGRAIHRTTIPPGQAVDAHRYPRAAAVAGVVHTPATVAEFAQKSRRP